MKANRTWAAKNNFGPQASHQLNPALGRPSDSWSKGRWFASRPGRYQVNYRSTQPSIPPG